MRNDEQQKPQGPQQPPQPYPGWGYDQGQKSGPPVRFPPGYPPEHYDLNNPNHSYQTPSHQTPSQPLIDQQHQPISQPLTDPYHPDLTMDMGNSLGYGQDIQYHSISMPQPTHSMPRLRQERLQKLRQDRMSRQQRQSAPDGLSQILQRRKSQPLIVGRAPSPPVPTALTPGAELQPATQPAQNTAMIQRINVARNSSLISGAFMLSSILGLVQTFLFTYIFGRSIAGEAYLQAYLIPNLIFTVIAGGALSSAFIPVFTSYSVQKKDEKTAWHIASSALNISVGGMIFFSIVAFLLAPVLVPLYSRADEVALTVTLTRIMLIQAIVLGSGVIVGAVLNARQDFTRTALGTVLYNVGLILGLIPGFFMTFHANSSAMNDTAVYAATWGVVLGAILQVGVQVPGLSKVKMDYKLAFDWRHPGVSQIGRQMIPRIINGVMLSFSTAVDRYLLTFLSTGLINSYLQAFSILLMPVSLFASSVSTAAFPSLAKYASEKRYDRVRSVIMETLCGILFLTIPSGVGMAVLSFPIAQALLEHGNFDLLAAQFASVVLFFFALGLPGLAAVEILTRSFYALQDSKTPVVVSVLQFVLKIALSILLISVAVFGVQWGMGALAFSTSVAGTLEAVALFILLSRQIGGFDLRDFWQFVGRALLASGAMAVVLFILRLCLDRVIDTTSMQKLYMAGIFMAVAKLLIELVPGALAFLVVARLLKIKEMNTGLVRRVLNLLRIPWL